MSEQFVDSLPKFLISLASMVEELFTFRVFGKLHCPREELSQTTRLLGLVGHRSTSKSRLKRLIVKLKS